MKHCCLYKLTPSLEPYKCLMRFCAFKVNDNIWFGSSVSSQQVIFTKDDKNKVHTVHLLTTDNDMKIVTGIW